MGLKIWERYFVYEFTKILILFLFCFYGLYVLIDYSSNASSFFYHSGSHITETAIYYSAEFSKRLDVLLPFALMIAAIKTLTSLNIHNELIALLSGGLSLKRLMRPFLAIGLLCTAISYVNIEYVLPSALNELKHIYDSRSREKHKHQQHPAAQHLILEDNSILVFHKYDSSQDLFYDAYWIKSIDDLYRIKYLYPNSSNVPEGKFVEHLLRDANGELMIADVHQAHSFQNMKFNKETLFETLTSPIELSISDLWSKLPSQQDQMSEKEAQGLSAFYIKLIMPWLCLLAILGPVPSCVRVTRNLPVFFIYAFSIFGLVAFYLLLDAALVLGERHAVMPALAIFLPFGIVTGIVGWRFVRNT